MTNQPIKITDYAHAMRRITDLITDVAQDEIADLAEEIFVARGGTIAPDDDDHYERDIEPIEEEIWVAVFASLTPLAEPTLPTD